MTKLSPIDTFEAMHILQSGRWLLRRVINVPSEYRTAMTEQDYRETAWSRIAQENAQLPLDSRIVPSDISLSEVSISFDSDSTALLMRIENDRGCVIRVPPYDLSYEASTDGRVVAVLYRSVYTLQRLCQVIREEACEYIPQTMQEFLQLAQERRAANIAKHAEQAERARDRRNAMRPEEERHTAINGAREVREYLLETLFGPDKDGIIEDVDGMIDLRTEGTPFLGICLIMKGGRKVRITAGDHPGQIMVNGITFGKFSST